MSYELLFLHLAISGFSGNPRDDNCIPQNYLFVPDFRERVQDNLVFYRKFHDIVHSKELHHKMDNKDYLGINKIKSGFMIII